MRAGLDEDRRTGPSHPHGGLEGRGRRGVNHVERAAGDLRDEGGALHGVGLDERGAAGVPGPQATGAVRVRRLGAVAHDPGELDGLGMRADHAAVGGRGLAQAKQKAVVDVGQAEAGALTAAVVHEDLEAGGAIVTHIGGDAGELGLGRDDEVVAEIDAGARLRDRADVLEQALERVGGHQVGDQAGDAPGSGCCRLAVGIGSHPRPADVLAVAEMQVDVDGSRQDHEPARVERLRGSGRRTRCENGGDLSPAQREVGLDRVRAGQHHVGAADHQVMLGHLRLLQVVCPARASAIASGSRPVASMQATAASSAATGPASSRRPALARNLACTSASAAGRPALP